MVYRDSDNVFEGRSTTGGSVQRFGFGAFADLLLLPGMFLVTLFFVYSPDFDYGIFSVVRYALGFFTVLFIPGYLLVAAIYPRRDSAGAAERLLMAVLFSAVIVPMACFFLDDTAWGIHLNTVLAVIALLTGALTLAAGARRLATPPARRYAVDFGGLYANAIKHLLPASKGFGDIALSALLLLSIVFVLAAAAYAATTSRGQLEHYTELYVCGPQGKLDNYPLVLLPNSTKPVLVGVANHEGGDVVYDLLVTFDDGNRTTPLYADRIAVGDGRNASRAVNLTPPGPYQTALIVFSLFKGEQFQAPYRQCYLRVGSAVPGAAPAEETASPRPGGLTGTPLGT